MAGVKFLLILIAKFVAVYVLAFVGTEDIILGYEMLSFLPQQFKIYFNSVRLNIFTCCKKIPNFMARVFNSMIELGNYYLTINTYCHTPLSVELCT